MGVNLGEGVVRISADLAPFRTAMVSARYQLASFVAGTRSLSQVGGFLAGNFLVSGFMALTKSMADAAISAGHLGETMNRIRMIFGDSAGVVIDFSNQMAKKLGMPKQALLETEAAFGQMALGAGMARKEAAEFAKIMTQAAIDAKSFMDVDLSVATNKIMSGLAGQIRPLREWGALLSAESIKQQAYRSHIAQTGHALTEQQKVMARSIVILKKLGVTEGDAMRTMNSTQMQSAAAIGNMQNAMTSFGEAIAPIWHYVVTIFNRAMGMIAGYMEDNKQSVFDWLMAITGEIEYLRQIFAQPIGEQLGKIFVHMFQIMTRALTMFGGEVPQSIDDIEGLLGAFLGFLENFDALLQKVLSGLNAIKSSLPGIMTIIDLMAGKVPGWGGNQAPNAPKPKAPHKPPQWMLDLGKIPEVPPEKPPEAQDVPKEKKHAAFQSFEEFYKQLQGGVGEGEKQQINRLDAIDQKMGVLVQAVQQRNGIPFAVAGGP